MTSIFTYLKNLCFVLRSLTKVLSLANKMAPVLTVCYTFVSQHFSCHFWLDLVIICYTYCLECLPTTVRIHNIFY